MRSRPELSDKEIQQLMDFDRLLAEKDTYLARRRRRMIRSASAGLLALLVLSVSLFYLNARKEPVDKEGPPPTQKIQEQMNTPQHNVIVDEKNATTKEPLPADKVARPGVDQAKAPDTRATAVQPADKTGADVYRQASPLNGYPALYEYFSRELQYPDVAAEDSPEGIVTVIFTIDIEGKPVGIQIENSLGQAFDREAVRVIEKMPAWEPASLNGVPVPSKISLPLTFEVKKITVKD